VVVPWWNDCGFFVEEEEEGRLATGEFLLLLWNKKGCCLSARVRVSYCENRLS
jgi:hypothetical protein